MKTPIVLRQVAGARDPLRGLMTRACRYLDQSANSVAVAFSSFQLDREPMTFRGGDVVQQSGGRAKINHEGIHLAVIVVIGEAGAAGNGFRIEHWAGGAGDVG